MYPPNSQQPMITLTGQTSELNGQVFRGSGTNLVLGRQQGSPLHINHSQVSRQHARLLLEGGQWLVEDLNSANGTFVNGQRTSGRVPLRPGDRLGLGSYEFIFQSSGNPADDRTLLATPAAYQAPPHPPQPQAPPQIYPQPQAPMAPPQGYPQPPQGYPQPPQGYPQQPQPPPNIYVQAAPQPKRRSCFGTCLIVGIILLFVTVIPTVGLGIYFYDDLRSAMNELGIGGGDGVSGNENVSVQSNVGGLVTTASGANLMIPPGAVPPQEDGNAGEMVFSMQEVPDRTPTLPGEFTPLGSVYQLGPEGFTFNAPIMLNLPIPAGVDPETVIGVTYFDEATNAWQILPAAVDMENRVATVATTHFSPWGVFGAANPDARNWRNNNGGTIRVSNEHRYNSGTYPAESERRLPYTVSYGVCIRSYNLDDPAQSSAWSAPTDWTMTVSDYVHPMSDRSAQRRQLDWWLPSGNYELIEVWHFSEVNQSPLYVPRFASYWRPIGPVRISARSQQAYSYSEASLALSSYTAGRPPCFGIQDTSVGTGDVQITLSWNASIDLDLYVTDPNGETIFYGNTSSSSGGQLDRDNLCSNMVVGRPENIFWPSGGAPSGTYTISVNYYGNCSDSGATSFTVRAVVQGQVQTFTGSVSPSNATVEVGTVRVR
ncbi:MAG: FHA domain-containing protein [Candidatus Viridilinea halotolerans]|uniref:FHA domain-containing protein n=1 Tax=Candidatus Viridilinea halotolerans TaxID=2491704 RepID=A0A426U0C3_9CHLR|nr:MAG: FHA domain-containing protein [Candidatus Viridilinea halotolerans]